MCLTFSVGSKRCSVIMISMTSCNLLLASFGASSSTVRFHPLSVLSNGIALPASILHAKARSGPKQTHCPCCVMGLRAIRGIRTTACRDSMVIGLPPVSLDTSKRRLSSHTTDLSAVECGTPLQRPSDICTLGLLDALPAPRFCTLPCRRQP